MPIGSQLKEGTYVGGTPSGTHTHTQTTHIPDTHRDRHAYIHAETDSREAAPHYLNVCQ